MAFLNFLSKSLFFLLITFAVLFGTAENCFMNYGVGFSVFDVSEESDYDYNSIIGYDYDVEYDFFLYELPSFKSEKLSSQSAGSVNVEETAEEGWAYVKTESDEGWLNLDKNAVYISHYVNSYNEPHKTGEYETLPPGEYVIMQTGLHDWRLIKTDIGDRWVDISAIPPVLYFNAPVYDQLTGYKSACESYAATIALNVCGSDITPADFISFVPQNITKFHYLNGNAVWGDPEEEFVGNMSGGGYAAYPPVIEKTINENLSETAYAEDITGAEYKDIVNHIASGGVVLIWFHPYGSEVVAPQSWLTPGGNEINADFGTHTVALIGYDVNKGTVMYNDSLGGIEMEVSWAYIEKTYTYTGRKALLVMPNNL